MATAGTALRPRPDPQLEEASRLFRYDTIFVLDPLDTFEDPDDIVWAKDREIRRVHELIVQGYYDAGYEPVFVGPNDAAGRLDFICANLRLPSPPGSDDHDRHSNHPRDHPRGNERRRRRRGRGAAHLANSVLANALLRSIDVLRPWIHASRPERIEWTTSWRPTPPNKPARVPRGVPAQPGTARGDPVVDGALARGRARPAALSRLRLGRETR
ncbi:MAG: ATP-binding protein [Actinomycetota bacterium]|nr:ATP-binding protein [Actinomycetota bacterium]